MAANNALKLGFVLSATDKMSRVIDEAVKKSTNKLSAFERTTGQASRALLKAGGLMVGAGAAIGAATFGVAKSTAAYGDAALKNSQAVGVNIEDWQKLAYAAKLANVEETELSGALIRLNKQLSDAANGSKTAGKVFTDLGIQLKDARGNLRAPNEVFTDLSKIFASVEDGTEKTALAYELFGRSGAKLIPLLNEGANGLQTMGAEAAAMGIVIGEEAAKKSVQFNDNLTRVSTSLQGLTMQFGTAFMPTLDNVIQKITGVIGKVSQWVQDNPKLAGTLSTVLFTFSGLLVVVGSASLLIGSLLFVVRKLAATYRAINTVIKVTTALYKGYTGATIAADKATKAYAVGQKIATIATKIFNAALKANPILRIITLIIAIGTAVYMLIKHWDKVKTFFIKLWDGIKQVFGKVWEWIKKMFLNYTPHGLIIKHWDSITAWFATLWDKVKTAFSSAWGWIKKMFLNYTPHGLIIKHWDSITAWFSGLWGKLKTAFGSAWEWIKKMFLNYTPHGLIIKHWDSITTWFTGLWDRVKNAFSNAWQSIASFFSSLNPVEWISNVWDTVGAFFSNLKTRFFGWGKDIIKGLINGVTVYAKKAVDSVLNIGKKIADKFKNLLGINSPSRLFLQYGLNITEGLTGGIDQGGQAVADSTHSLAQSATRGVQQSVQTNNVQSPTTANNWGGVTLNYSPTIHIAAEANESTKQDFLKMLRSHRDEIIEILERYNENKQRLAF